MKLSLVIPTMDRLKSLQRVLASLLEQTYPYSQFEVIVVSDGSSDGTGEYLTTLKTPFRLVPVLQVNQGAAGARNTGINQAQGEVVIFLDDDTVPAPGFIEEHAKMHEQYGNKAVIIGPMLRPVAGRPSPGRPYSNWRPSAWISWELARLVEQYQNMLAGKWKPTPRQFYTANASVLRSLLIEAGCFDGSFRRAEDIELAYRLEKKGAHFIFAPQAVVYHYAERSINSWSAIPYAYGANDVVFASQKGETWILPTVYKEFHTRHPLIKGLTRVCAGRRIPMFVTTTFLKQAILLFDRLRWIMPAHLACSALFNLRYYQGITDTLESRAAFMSGIYAAAENIDNMPSNSLP